ncbi:unnamed protein product [Diabrotica balteata]|uniref:Reverse transcriptase domain-containing protein n=1 Tax=Diabrotica balteata TaxID=107213 RepID=A0A9N9T5M6_DIABA|nr:unnamed protein product [Diabrotica balteata]
MIEEFNAIQRAATHRGLNINEIKTKYMKASKSTGQRNLQSLTIGNYNIESVKSFTYLGSLVTADNNISKEIKRTTHIANKTYNGLIKHLRFNNITRKTKCKIYKSLKKPVLVYGSET